MKKHGGKEGLKMPMGNSHWEKKMQELPVSDLKYASEMGAPEELHDQVSKLSNYVKKNKMSY